MATRPRQRLTYDDYAAFPDDGHRWELIEGEAFMCASPTTGHQLVAQVLFRWIADFVDLHTLGSVFMAPIDVVLSENNVYQPDVLFISQGRAEIVTAKNIQGPPTWVIEVVSDPVRDKKVKRDIYARFGVAEYWTIDLELRLIEIHQPGGETASFGAGDTVKPRALPGLAINVSKVFEPLGQLPRRM